MSEEEQFAPSKGLRWDKPFYFFQDQPFVPAIYDGKLSTISEGFNAVKIKIDGRMKSDLDWKQAQIQAQDAIKQGYFILWEIDLGLFSDLSYPLNHQTQYLSLSLSVDHFRDTLWKEFQEQTLGLAVYNGSADFSESFKWANQYIENLREWVRDIFENEQVFEKETGIAILSFSELFPTHLMQTKPGRHALSLFCRDVAIEYMALLTAHLPDLLPRYLLLDIPANISPSEQAQLMNPECFEQFGLIVKGSAFSLQALGLSSPSPYGYMSCSLQENQNRKDIKIGICLPAANKSQLSHLSGLDEAIAYLLGKNLSFRLIAENHLITEWDGLDDLLYMPTGLSVQGKRKLQGFCAAGGSVVTLGHPLGLANEVQWEEWKAEKAKI